MKSSQFCRGPLGVCLVGREPWNAKRSFVDPLSRSTSPSGQQTRFRRNSCVPPQQTAAKPDAKEGGRCYATRPGAYKSCDNRPKRFVVPGSGTGGFLRCLRCDVAKWFQFLVERASGGFVFGRPDRDAQGFVWGKYREKDVSLKETREGGKWTRRRFQIMNFGRGSGSQGCLSKFAAISCDTRTGTRVEHCRN
ncbi:hypothetical protein VTI28DRAFT_1078 [Corynascus sepedonium]